MSTRRSVLLSGVAALSLVAGVSSFHSASAAQRHGGHTYAVRMVMQGGGFVFKPSKLRVKVGDTVLWQDANQVPHNIVGLGRAATVIDRASVTSGSYRVTFKHKGTYKYECQVHLPEMKGVIVVQ